MARGTNRKDAKAAKTRGLEELVSPIQGYGEFEIDIEKVMRAELRPRIEALSAAPLSKENIQLIPERAKGAYVLHLDNVAVYAGKTDTKHGFRDRLLRHHFTLQHRSGVDLSRITFKAVRVMVFSNFDVEAILIAEMRRGDKKALPWNNTGFGSNDPGHNREREEPGDFDRTNPINIDMPLEGAPVTAGDMPLFTAFLLMKEWLPFTFRWETDLKSNGRPANWAKGHKEYHDETAVVKIPEGSFTARQFLNASLNALPKGWRVTVFPGRVIIYKDPTIYPYALEYFENNRSTID